MSYPPPPPRPVAGEDGESPELIYMQKNWDVHWDPKVNIFVDTPLLKFSKTPKGYVPVLRIPSAGPPGKTLDANYKLMIITQLGSSLAPTQPDLVVCREWKIATNTFVFPGSDIYVAKDIESRRITQEYYLDNGDNLKQTYTYFSATQADPSYGDNFRLANDGTNTELQVMEKRYYTKDQMAAGNVEFFQALVYVIDTGLPTGIKDPTGKDVTHIEVKPFRAWVRYASQ